MNPQPFTFGSLFAGIGGMDLGLERAGMQCRWQVEIDPFARRVLEKHWPDVRRHDDVRTFPDGNPDDWRVDLIAGGFPCQDISNAGKRAGIEGERSGLWREYIRIVRLVRPRFVLVENVSALLHRGMGQVLGDLAESGYDAEWQCIPAAAVGAPHIRERVFVLAYASRQYGPVRRHIDKCDTKTCRRQDRGLVFGRRPSRTWDSEPAIHRVANGLPGQVDRLRGLGNAVVPQVAEWIGRMILEAC